MLAQFQNHWEGYWNEHQYGAKVCADAGRSGADHYRANQCHHEERSEAKWKSALYYPSDPGSGGAILPAADGENISGCTEGESIRHERQTRTPSMTACVRLCEDFSVEVGKQYQTP